MPETEQRTPEHEQPRKTPQVEAESAPTPEVPERKHPSKIARLFYRIYDAFWGGLARRSKRKERENWRMDAQTSQQLPPPDALGEQIGRAVENRRHVPYVRFLDVLFMLLVLFSIAMVLTGDSVISMWAFPAFIIFTAFWTYQSWKMRRRVQFTVGVLLCVSLGSVLTYNTPYRSAHRFIPTSCLNEWSYEAFFASSYSYVIYVLLALCLIELIRTLASRRPGWTQRARVSAYGLCSVLLFPFGYAQLIDVCTRNLFTI